MSVPPELMKVIAGGAGKSGGGVPPMSGSEGAPMGAPMTTPQPNEGEQQSAMINISLAMDLLEKALPPFGAESDVGKAIMGSLSALTKVAGEKRDSAQPLIPAELKILMQQAGKTSPEMQAMGAGGAPGAGPGAAGAVPGGMPMAA